MEVSLDIECQINQLVYKLCSLIEEEIKVFEGSVL